MVILCAHLLKRHFIPDAAPIAAYFDALGPTAPAVGPPSQLDLAVVYDLLIADWGHDCARYWHGLYAEAVAVRDVVLAHLRAVVDVFFHLDGRKTGLSDDVDSIQPLTAPSPDLYLRQHSLLDISLQGLKPRPRFTFELDTLRGGDLRIQRLRHAVGSRESWEAARRSFPMQA